MLIGSSVMTGENVTFIVYASVVVPATYATSQLFPAVPGASVAAEMPGLQAAVAPALDLSVQASDCPSKVEISNQPTSPSV